jgi:Arc/MetJ-type ribon-helix-helix transcriptional regulator
MTPAMIPVEYEPFVNGLIREGTFPDASSVVGEALRCYRLRTELIRDVNAGIAQLDRGEVISGDDMFRRLEAKYGTGDDLG